MEGKSYSALPRMGLRRAPACKGGGRDGRTCGWTGQAPYEQLTAALNSFETSAMLARLPKNSPASTALRSTFAGNFSPAWLSRSQATIRVRQLSWRPSIHHRPRRRPHIPRRLMAGQRLLHRVPRDTEPTSDRPDRHPLSPVQPMDLRPILHLQHPSIIRGGSTFTRKQRISIQTEPPLRWRFCRVGVREE